ncbi:MAG TPA: HAMP domain-containing sensor histidine kinase [Pseudomonadales bacterium]
MTLRNAVILFGLLLAGVYAALTLALVNTTDLLDSQARELARAGDSVRVAQSLRNRLLAHNRNDFLFQLNDDPARFESSAAQRNEIEALLNEAESLVNNSAEGNVVDTVRAALNAYLARRDELEQQALSPTERYTLASIELDAANAGIEELTAVNRRQMDELLAAIAARNSNADFMAGALFVLGAITLSGVAIAVFHFVTRPLGELTRIIAAFSDTGSVTHVEPKGLREIRTLSANFNSMTARLEEKRKDRLRFIASIAHDLRNPLGSMSITAELLRRQQPSEATRIVEVLSRQIKVLERLVSDLLDTAHIESGHLKLTMAPHDIGALVRDAVELHASTSNLHKLDLQASDNLLCPCDDARLTQVINNLLSNAIKYSPNGGTITVRALRTANAVTISVADEGIGIHAEDLAGIFKPFQRTTATRATIPGIGLGLSASRRIIEAHGGTLTVQSEPGHGSTFTVSLPCS